MNMIYLSSDLHFNHSREFVYKPRGFDSVEDMNIAIVNNFNSIVTPEDDLYLLGDLMLGQDMEAGLELVRQLNGRIHIVRGNHDSDRRWEAYRELPNVIEMAAAIYLHYRKYHFYLSHFPTLTGNLEKESLKQMTCNLFGHTHSKEHFFEDRPYMYNVAVDAHNCTPVLLDHIIVEMNEKVKECIDYL